MTAAERPNPWDGDWEQRIYERLGREGFRSLTEFARARSGATFGELASALGPDVAITQLEVLLRNEVKSPQELEYLARESLVRLLREYLPAGWGLGEKPDFQAARAMATWISTIGEHHAAAARRTWSSLRSILATRQGWQPSGPDDEVLRMAFQQFTADDQPPNS